MLTTEQLQAIRERVNKATSSPWVWGREIAEEMQPDGDVYIKTWAGEVQISTSSEDDAEFIAHAREDVPALLDEIERLGEALDKQIALSEELAKQRDEWKYKYIARPMERDAEIERLRGALESVKGIVANREQLRPLMSEQSIWRDLEGIVHEALAGESE